MEIKKLYILSDHSFGVRRIGGMKKMEEISMKRSSVREEFDMVFEEENINRAVKSLQRKIEGFEDGKKLGDAHYLLGYLYRRQGEEDKSYNHLKRSEELRREVNDKEGLVETLSFLGSIEREKGHEEKRLERLAEAADLARGLENFQGAGTFYGMVANGYDDLGKTEEVFHYQSKAIEMVNQLNKSGESTVPVEGTILKKILDKREKRGKLPDFQKKRLEGFKEEYEGESEVIAAVGLNFENPLSAKIEELDSSTRA